MTEQVVLQNITHKIIVIDKKKEEIYPEKARVLCSLLDSFD